MLKHSQCSRVAQKKKKKRNGPNMDKKGYRSKRIISLSVVQLTGPEQVNAFELLSIEGNLIEIDYRPFSYEKRC